LRFDQMSRDIDIASMIVNDETHYGQLFLVLGVMAVMSAALLVWSKRKGWWGKG
jgi:hypothetical protein